MRLYLDSSALVKRYVAEPASDVVRQTMGQADEWFICRVGYVEVVRALGLTGGHPAVRAFKEEWGAFGRMSRPLWNFGDGPTAVQATF